MISVVLVDSWRHMEPAALVDWFSIYAPMMGAVQAPTEVLAVALTLAVTIAALKGDGERTQTSLWFFALVLLVGTLILLPVYFVEANTNLIEKTIDLSQVPDEVERWWFWNWIRTGLTLCATALIVVGMAKDAQTRGQQGRTE